MATQVEIIEHLQYIYFLKFFFFFLKPLCQDKCRWTIFVLNLWWIFCFFGKFCLIFDLLTTCCENFDSSWRIFFLSILCGGRYICKNPSSSSRTGQNVVSKEMWCVSLRPAGIEIYEIHLVLIFLCTANFFWKITFSFVHFQFFT